jgi:hypothetical protein
MMCPKVTAAPPTSSAHQNGPVKKKKMKRRKKKERYRDSVAIDSLDQGALESVARALSSGTCSQTSKLEDLPDHPALDPVARALSFRTCSQTSKLGGIAGPACSGTYSQSSELWNL